MDSSKSVIDSINSNKSQFNKCSSNTIRLTIDLNQKDENGCAVFNYQELIKAEKERLRTLNGFSDLSQNEDEEALKKIALHYEEKYGGGSNMRYQTYTELGAGYDENDSFIDNTEACEEGLQEDTEPKRGSYYVNMGKLEFKKVKNYFDGKKGKKRRIAESDSENITDMDEKRPKYEKTDKLIDEPDSKNSSTKYYSETKKSSKSKKLLKEKSIEEAVFKESKFRNEKGKKRKNSSSFEPKLSVINESSGDAFENSAQIEDLQSVIEEKRSEKNPQNNEKCDKIENDSGDTSAAVSNSETSNSADVVDFQKDDAPKLPELSSELNSIINELKSMASHSSQRKFFNERTGALLYRLECSCRKELNSSGRHAIYAFLVSYLPFAKSTLVSRIREVFVNKDQLKSIITRITQVVTSFTNLNEDYEMQHQCMEEVKPLIENAVEIKVRQYVAMRKKKHPLEYYLYEFLKSITSIWPAGTITINSLHNIVADTIRLEAESYKMTYTPTIPKDSQSDASLNFNEIILNNAKKITEDLDEEMANGKTGNDLRVIKDIKQKGDDTRRMSPIHASIKERDSHSIVMKISHKKKNCKRDSGKRHHNHHNSKVNDERDLEKDRRFSAEKCLTKFCSADEKVQMQLDQVMQDLVVLNQMSSDTASTNK